MLPPFRCRTVRAVLRRCHVPASRAAGSAALLKARYQREVEGGRLDTDPLQRQVVDFLAQALDKTKTRQAAEAQEGPGFAGRPGWVLPQATAGGGASVAEEHRRAAEWTARLAAENARRAGAARKARALHAATEAPPEVASKADAEKAPEVRKPPQKSSVYLHGPVGTGKTMLMDLFYEASREAGCRTLRRHFYEFMMGLHRQIHQIQEERPVEVAANALADDIDVLCFDEFQVADIQDAAILPRLFEVLFLRGVTVVMTTNTAPQLLYTGGLNRHVHLPAFIRLLAEHCTVLGLGAKSVDYRRKAEAAELASGAARDAFLVGDKGLEQFAARWREMLEEVGLPEAEVVLKLPMGRQLSIPKAAGPACSISFQELCEGHRGEADFYALTERFRTIFLSGVPRFTSLEDADVVRRFVKALDLFYDRRVRLVLHSAAELEELFAAIRAEVNSGDMSDLAWRTAMYSADGKAGLSPQAVGTLCEAVRASERAESRLRQMRTRQYWQSCSE